MSATIPHRSKSVFGSRGGCRKFAGVFIALLIAWQAECRAAENDCVAKVRITSLGVPRITENWRSMMSTVGPYRYRLDATSEEKRCINLTFNIVLRFIDKEDKPDTAVYPASMRIRNGAGSEIGDMAGRRGDSAARAAIEDLVCKRC